MPTFMVPAGLKNVRVGSFYRLASGDQAVTGVGFKPKAVIFFAASSGGANQILSVGFTDGTNNMCKALIGDSVEVMNLGTDCIYVRVNGSNVISAYVASMDADGFTLTWSLLGAVTAYVCYMALA